MAEEYSNPSIPKRSDTVLYSRQASLQVRLLSLFCRDNPPGTTMSTVDELVHLWGRDKSPEVLERTVREALEFSLSGSERLSSVVLMGAARGSKRIRLARKDVCDGVLVVRLLGSEVHPDVHVHATACLADLAEQSPNQLRIASYSGVLDALTSHLQKVDNKWVPGQMQENTLRCLANLAQTQGNHMQMASSSVLDPLVKLLSNDASTKVHQQAARCLTNLALSKDNNERIANYPDLLDALAALLHKPSHKDGGSAVHIQTLECLTNLASSQRVQLKIVSEYSILLDALVRSLGEKGTSNVQRQSLKCLTNLSDNYQRNRIHIASHTGLLDALLRLLRHNWATTDKIKVQFEAARCFLKLLSAPDNLVRIASHAGTFDALLKCLEPKARIREVQNSAIESFRFLSTAPENQVKIASFPGAVSALLSQLPHAENPEGQVLAAICLSNLASASEAKPLLARHQGLLKALLALLNGQSTSLLEPAMKCLLRLSQSDELRVRVKITSQHGLIDTLVRLLGNNLDVTIQEYAANCLSNLALTPQTAEQIVSHPNVLISLVNLLQLDANSAVLEYTAKCLTNLAFTDEIQVEMASFPGMLNALVLSLSVRNDVTHGVQEQVVRCLAQLSAQPANQLKIASYPGVYDALSALAADNAHPRAQQQAAICLTNLKLNPAAEGDRTRSFPGQPAGPQRRQILSSESMSDPDAWFVDPITWDTMCDPVKCNDGVTYDRWTIINNEIQQSPYDRSLTRFCIACDDIDVRKRLFRVLPQQEAKFRELRETYREKALQSARALDVEDAIEQLSNVLKWAPSDAECRSALDEILNLLSGQPPASLDARDREISLGFLDSPDDDRTVPYAIGDEFSPRSLRSEDRSWSIPILNHEDVMRVREREGSRRALSGVIFIFGLYFVFFYRP